VFLSTFAHLAADAVAFTLRRVFGFQLLLFALVLGLVQFFFRRVRPFMGRRDGIISCVCCRSKNRGCYQNRR
jgi:hypothetical protein